jgi:broad specificity phosphatase PhoE
MSEINLLLVRHGEAAESWGNHPDPGLSELGIKQSASLVNNKMLELLDSYSFVSSPKLRAKITAEPLIKKLNKELIINDAYSEIPSNDIDNSQKKVWLTNVMNTEIRDLPDFVVNWRNNIIKHSLGVSQNTIIFTHFMVINVLVSSLLKKNALMYFHPNYVSITKITLENKKVKSISLGDEKKTIINL